MKTLYIKPEVEFEQIEMFAIMVNSWDTEPKDFTDDPDKKGDKDPTGEVVGGSTFGEAKESTFIWDDEF